MSVTFHITQSFDLLLIKKKLISAALHQPESSFGTKV